MIDTKIDVVQSIDSSIMRQELEQMNLHSNISSAPLKNEYIMKASEEN